MSDGLLRVLTLISALGCGLVGGILYSRFVRAADAQRSAAIAFCRLNIGAGSSWRAQR